MKLKRKSRLNLKSDEQLNEYMLVEQYRFLMRLLVTCSDSLERIELQNGLATVNRKMNEIKRKELI